MVEDVAIVGYLPGEAGRYIADLVRAHVPAVPVRRPHITFMPGRPPALPDAELLRRLRQRAQNFLPLELTLGEVRNFLPLSPVLYLDVVAGMAGLDQLRRVLLEATENSHPERFPFHPHLTLAYDQSPEEILALQPRLQAGWAKYPGPRRLRFTQLMLVRQTGPASWQDLGSAAMPGME